MILKCPECESENVEIVDKDNIEEVAKSIPIGVSFCMPPMEPKTKYLVCKDCGYWKRIKILEPQKDTSIPLPFPLSLLKHIIVF